MNESSEEKIVDSGAKRIRIREAAIYCGVSETTFRTWAKQPGFPKPFRPSKRTVFYQREEIDKWLDGTRY